MSDAAAVLLSSVLWIKFQKVLYPVQKSNRTDALLLPRATGYSGFRVAGRFTGGVGIFLKYKSWVPGAEANIFVWGGGPERGYSDFGLHFKFHPWNLIHQMKLKMKLRITVAAFGSSGPKQKCWLQHPGPNFSR